MVGPKVMASILGSKARVWEALASTSKNLGLKVHPTPNPKPFNIVFYNAKLYALLLLVNILNPRW